VHPAGVERLAPGSPLRLKPRPRKHAAKGKLASRAFWMLCEAGACLRIGGHAHMHTLSKLGSLKRLLLLPPLLLPPPLLPPPLLPHPLLLLLARALPISLSLALLLLLLLLLTHLVPSLPIRTRLCHSPPFHILLRPPHLHFLPLPLRLWCYLLPLPNLRRFLT